MDVSFSSIQLKGLSANVKDERKQQPLLKLGHIGANWSFSSLFSGPMHVQLIEIKDGTIYVEGALLASRLDFGSDDDDSEKEKEEKSKNSTGAFRIDLIKLRNLQIDQSHPLFKDNKLTVPKVKELDIKSLKDRDFASFKDMLNALIRAISSELKKQKLFESIFINTGLLPKEILKEGLEAPKEVLKIIPKLFLNKLKEDTAPKDSSPSEPSPEKSNEKLKKRLHEKKETTAIKKQSRKINKDDRDYKPVPIEQLEEMFKGIPEKLFEKN